jgi:hypothetical protein
LLADGPFRAFVRHGEKRKSFVSRAPGDGKDRHAGLSTASEGSTPTDLLSCSVVGPPNYSSKLILAGDSPTVFLYWAFISWDTPELNIQCGIEFVCGLCGDGRANNYPTGN